MQRNVKLKRVDSALGVVAKTTYNNAFKSALAKLGSGLLSSQGTFLHQAKSG